VLRCSPNRYAQSSRSIGCACAQRRNQQGGTHRRLHAKQLLPILGEGSNIIVISSLGAHAVVGKRGVDNPSLLAYTSTKGARSRSEECGVDRGDCYSVNLRDLELAVGPRCSPVDLLATPLASLLSMHRVPWRLNT
jgi:hypothetical protein